MASQNSINNDLTYCSSLSLTTGVTGNYPVTCFNSGINASASTYLTYDANGSGSLAWRTFPIVQPGPQGAIAYMPTNREWIISPHTPTATRSVYLAYSSTVSNGTISNLQLNDGQFPYTQTSSSAVVAGQFLVAAGSPAVVTNGPNSIKLEYLPTIITLTSSSAITLNSVKHVYMIICDSSSLINITFPSVTTATPDFVMGIIGKGSGGWTMTLPTGFTMRINTSATSTGRTVSSASASDCMLFSTRNSSSVWGSIGLPQSSGLILT